MKSSTFIVSTIVILSSTSSELLFGTPKFQNGTWQFQAALSQQVSQSQEGSAVTLSPDGTTLIACAPVGNLIQIYESSGDTWKHIQSISAVQNWKTVNSNIAVSAYANIMALGTSELFSETGQTDIYIQSGHNSWDYQATLSQKVENSQEGSSVSLSVDGNTLAAGSPASGGYGVYAQTQIYVKTGNSWIHQDSLTTQTARSKEGFAVSLSADGNTLAAGDPAYNNYGAAQIYVRSGTTWTHQATVSQHSKYSQEGYSVSLSADGNVLAVGSPDHANQNGATHIYARSGSQWKHQATLSQQVDSSREGLSVSLSADGTTLAAGAPIATSTNIYSNSSNEWTYQTTLTQGAWGEGWSIFLANNTVAAGALTNNGNGETLIYVDLE